VRSVIVGFIAVLATIYFGVLYGNSGIVLLGFSFAIFFLISYGTLFYLYFHTDVTVQVSMPIVELGKSVRLLFDVEESSMFTAGKVRYLVVIKNNFHNETIKKWVEDSEYTFVPQFPGRLSVKIKKVRIYDRSGFFFLTCKCKSFDNVKVMPEIELVPVQISSKTRNFFGDADTYDDFRPGYDPAEVFQIREFQNGDKLQNVHWKLSAKANDLIVKENSLPKACGVTLLVNPEEERSYVSLLSYLASLSYSMMDLECPHYVAWYSESHKDIVRARVDDEESYFTFLNYFLEDGMIPQIDATALYKEKYHAELTVKVLEVSKVTPETWDEEVRI